MKAAPKKHSRTRSQKELFPYIHGFSSAEQARLRKQAQFAETTVYRDINFDYCKTVLEIGCGVGAQTEILLRRFPQISLTSIDSNLKQLKTAKAALQKYSELAKRVSFKKMDALKLQLKAKQYDAVFICWVLEHVSDPRKILKEARRVLKPGGKIYLTEVMNHTFFLEPYSPFLWKYWMAFNDYQYDGAGDPFIGAKLGNHLLEVGYENVKTHFKIWHLDNRTPQQRADVIDYWTELLLSAAEQLIQAGYVDVETLKKAKKELAQVKKDPNAVFIYAFMQASATTV